MACSLDMYNQNSEHKGHGPPMSPRISFSNDFAESSHASSHHQMIKRDTAPASSDFEFSVANHSMMSADELFFKGRLLPFKDSCSSKTTTTLREELLAGEDDDVSVTPPKGWKGLLGLRKTHIGSKKADKSDGSVERRSALVIHEEVPFQQAFTGTDK